MEEKSYTEPAVEERVSRNIGEMLRELRAHVHVRRETEKRGARVWGRERVVRNARTDGKLPIILCSPTGVMTGCPHVRESGKLKFLPVLMATVINPRCQEAAEAHIRGLVTETKTQVI